MTQGSLAEKLRVLRAREGLSLTEAAARAGVTRDTLSDVEHGKRQPYMPTLSKIAAGYGVPVEELLEEPALAGKGEAPQETGPRGPDLEGLTEDIEDMRTEVAIFERFHTIQRTMDAYREAWEQRLAEGDFDTTAAEEAGRAIKAFWPAVHAEAQFEIDRIMGHGASFEEAEAQSVVAQAMKRFIALGDKVNSMYREQLLNASASNVVQGPWRLPEAS